MKTQSPWLTAFLDVIACPYCRSGEVALKRHYDVHVQWCLCGECGREFKVSKKRWTRYHRMAVAAGAALARDMKAKGSADVEKMSRDLRGWGHWICSSGLPKGVWEVIAKAAAEVIEAERGADPKAPCEQVRPVHANVA